jgi:hypothetical protein
MKSWDRIRILADDALTRIVPGRVQVLGEGKRLYTTWTQTGNGTESDTATPGVGCHSGGCWAHWPWQDPGPRAEL